MKRDVIITICILVICALPSVYIARQVDIALLFPAINLALYALLQHTFSFHERWCTATTLLTLAFPVAYFNSDLALQITVGSIAIGFILPKLTKRARRRRRVRLHDV
jgi:general stress protein CsbA